MLKWQDINDGETCSFNAPHCRIERCFFPVCLFMKLAVDTSGSRY